MSEHRPSEERRDQIVDAMIEALAEHGYAKATIAKIAGAAGLTPGLLHYHFPNKQAILLGALAQLAGEQLVILEDLAARESPAEALDEILRTMLAPRDQAKPVRVAAWVAILAEAIRAPDVANELSEALVHYRDIIADVLTRGAATGDFDLGDLSAGAAGAALVALIQGYFTVGVTAREAVPSMTAYAAASRMARALTTA